MRNSVENSISTWTDQQVKELKKEKIFQKLKSNSQKQKYFYINSKEIIVCFKNQFLAKNIYWNFIFLWKKKRTIFHLWKQNFVFCSINKFYKFINKNVLIESVFNRRSCVYCHRLYKQYECCGILTTCCLPSWWVKWKIVK